MEELRHQGRIHPCAMERQPPHAAFKAFWFMEFPTVFKPAIRQPCPCSRPHAADIMQRSRHPLRPGSSSSFWFMQLPTPTASGRHHLRHPFGSRPPMVGRHQDKVETVEAVIPATLEKCSLFVHFCIINREQLFDITVKFCFMKIHEKYSFHGATVYSGKQLDIHGINLNKVFTFSP